jgi:DNA-binding CsgD family transcriptional regulator
LEATPEPTPARVLAGHFLAARDLEAFVRYGWDAAVETAVAGSPQEHLALLEALVDALREPGVGGALTVPPVTIALALVRARRIAGDATGAATLAAAVIDGLYDGRAIDRAEAGVERAAALTESAHRDAKEAALAAVDEVCAREDTPSSTRLLARATGTLVNFVPPPPVDAALEVIIRARTWGLDDVGSRAENTIGCLLAATDPVAALAAMERARVLAESSVAEDPTLLLRYHINTTDILWLHGRYDAAAGLAAAGLTFASDHGLASTAAPHLAACRAQALLDAGRLIEARQLVTTWLPRARADRDLIWLRCLAGRTSLAEGDHDAARTEVTDLEREVEGRDLPESAALAWALLRGELAVDLAASTPTPLRLAEEELYHGAVTLRLLALAALRTRQSNRPGDTVAWQRFDQALTMMDWVHQSVAGPWLASIEACRPSDAPASRKALDQAVEATRSETPVAWQARILLAAAEQAVAVGAGQRARRLLHQAKELLYGRGFLGLEKDVLRCATSIGTQPGVSAPALSNRETEVLKAVARGKTNANIADDFVLSIRTVEAHLSHILRKLDVRSRGEAVAAALDTGLLSPDDLGP